MEISGQVPPVFLGTAPPVAGIGAPHVMAPPPTTAVEVIQGPLEYVQGQARSPTTVTVSDPRSTLLHPHPRWSGQPWPPRDLRTAETVYQEGTVTYTAPATTVMSVPAPVVEKIAPAPAASVPRSTGRGMRVASPCVPRHTCCDRVPVATLTVPVATATAGFLRSVFR